MAGAEQARTTDAFRPQVYRLVRTARELADTVTLEFTPLDGDRPDFAPGQFNMLYVFGVGEIAISMSGRATKDNRLAHTVRAVGAVSTALANLEVGASIGLRGPFGRGWPLPVEAGSDLVIVAGGLGLAPLRPAVYDLLAERERYGRVIILFGTRHPTDLLFRKEMQEWRRRGDIEVEVTVDHADAGWKGHVGVVPALIPGANFDARKATALVCGPEVMMRFSINALRDAGVGTDRIYLSMERNMKCAIGLCGHCQYGPTFICRDGPVMRFDKIADIFSVREI